VLQLKDDLIYLRKIEAADLERTWEWINTPEIFLIMGVNAPVTKTAQLRWFEALDRASDKLVFAVCLSEGDRHVGNVSLDTIDLRHRNARLSIFLADPVTRGKGIGTRAISLLLDYAFDYLNLHRVYCKMDSLRDDVLNFYRKLGFSLEGRMREHEFVNGRYVDKSMVAILRSEWGARRHRTP